MDVDRNDLTLMAGVLALGAGAFIILGQKKTVSVQTNPNAPWLDWIQPAVLPANTPLGSSLTVSGRNFSSPTTVIITQVIPVNILHPALPQTYVITPVSPTILLIKMELVTAVVGVSQTFYAIQVSNNYGASNILYVEVLQ